MTIAGWITMLISVLFVWTFFFVCMIKVLRTKEGEEDLPSLERRLPDMNDDGEP